MRNPQKQKEEPVVNNSKIIKPDDFEKIIREKEKNKKNQELNNIKYYTEFILDSAESTLNNGETNFKQTLSGTRYSIYSDSINKNIYKAAKNAKEELKKSGWDLKYNESLPIRIRIFFYEYIRFTISPIKSKEIINKNLIKKIFFLGLSVGLMVGSLLPCLLGFLFFLGSLYYSVIFLPSKEEI